MFPLWFLVLVICIFFFGQAVVLPVLFFLKKQLSVLLILLFYCPVFHYFSTLIILVLPSIAHFVSSCFSSTHCRVVISFFCFNAGLHCCTFARVLLSLYYMICIILCLVSVCPYFIISL